MNRDIRVLLVSIEIKWRFSNLGIDQLASYLRLKGVKTEVVYFHLKESAEEIKSELLKYEFDVIGFSAHNDNVRQCIDAANWIKRLRNAAVVFGGYFPTMYPKEVLDMSPSVDYVVMGDGEAPLMSLIRFFSGEALRYDELYIAKAGATDHKKMYQNTTIDYSPVFDFYEKVTPRLNHRKVHCIQIKNNICTGQCSFCTERKGKAVFKELDLIVDEIEKVARNYGVKKILFSDDNMLDPNNDEAKNFVRALCERIKEKRLNIAMQFYCKAISFKDTAEDRNLLSLMASVGFSNAFVGLESGNSQDLLLYNKLTSVEDNDRIVKLLREAEINPIIGFINFNPYSTLKKLKANYEFLLSIGSSDCFHYFANYVMLHPHTALYAKAWEDGLILPAHSFMNVMAYEFADEKARPVLKFIYETLRPRILKFKIETEVVVQCYFDCKRVDPVSAELFTDEIGAAKGRYLTKIKEYADRLYMDKDFRGFQNGAETFLSFAEEDQAKLNDLYKRMMTVYSDAELFV